MRPLVAGLVLLALPALAVGQSLGNAAQKEKERRQKNRDAGVQSRVVTDEEMGAARPAPSPRPSPGPEGAGASPAPSTSPSPSPEPLPDSSQVRQRQEAQWRARVVQVLQRIEGARAKYERYSRLTLVPGEYFADSQGRPVITSPEQLQKMTAQAKAELEAAEKALSDLEDDARRANVPPGWLR